MPALLALLLLLVAAPARAQVNAETLTAEVTEPGWAFGADIDLSLASGNTNVLTVGLEGAVRFLTLHPKAPRPHAGWFRDRFLVDGSWSLKRLRGEDAQNQAFVHARYTRMFLPRLGVDLYAQLQYDQQLLLDWRVLGGTGLRVVLAQHARVSAWLGSGYMVEHEVRDIPEGFDDPRLQLNHRWSSYLTLRFALVPGRVTVANTVYVQPRFDELADVQILEEARLEVGVLPWLSVALPVRVRHDSRPPADLHPTDVRLGAALVFRAALGRKAASDDDVGGGGATDAGSEDDPPADAPAPTE